MSAPRQLMLGSPVGRSARVMRAFRRLRSVAALKKEMARRVLMFS